MTKQIIIFLFLTCIASGQSVSQEKVKAIFVEKFALFSEWPQPEQDDSVFILAIYGKSDVADEIKDIYSDSFIGKKLKILELSVGDSIPYCHVLFIAHRNPKTLKQIITTIAGRPILTISDQKGYAAAGVIINMYLERRQVRFEINKSALSRSSLTISYKLLHMAKILEDE